MSATLTEELRSKNTMCTFKLGESPAPGVLVSAGSKVPSANLAVVFLSMADYFSGLKRVRQKNVVCSTVV